MCWPDWAQNNADPKLGIPRKGDRRCQVSVIAFYLLNRAFSYMAVVYGFNALAANLIPVMLFFGFALWKMRGVGR